MNKLTSKLTGLLIDDVSRWRVHRRIIEPAFNSSVLKSFFSIFNEKTLSYIKVFETLVDGPQTNLSPIWMKLACENLMSTSFRMSDNDQDNKTNKMVSLMNE